MRLQNFFPKGQELKDLLGLRHQAELEDLFDRSLFSPIETITSRPAKSLRSDLVFLGFQVGAARSEQSISEDLIYSVSEIIELLHAGSLIVDDIEDGSTNRRGGPTVHTLFGVPIALNAANWLYFLPFQKINNLKISDQSRSLLMHECHRTLLRAHFGQALDVGVMSSELEQERIYEASLATIELKSGVLAGFALKAGAIVAGANAKVADCIEDLGSRLGMALQMFDDIGNVTSLHNPAKKAEDLKLKRLGYIIAQAARLMTSEQFSQFKKLCAELPLTFLEVKDYLDQTGVLKQARQSAEIFLDQAILDLKHELTLNTEEFEQLKKFKQILMSNYD